jgi:phenylalanyl-tRNA synthetase alpha chain
MSIQSIHQEALQAIEAATSVASLSEVRQVYLSKKGVVASLMSTLKDLSVEERKSFGAQVNTLKSTLEAAFELAQVRLEALELNANLKKEAIDLTLPGTSIPSGTLHPLTLVAQSIEDVFIGLGYQVVEGPEVELDTYNFERANIPANHPARDMQDTFYIDVEWLLRTHTTAIQTRVLEASAPHVPIKVICPGKVYRKDDDDATHSHQFMQIEGLVVGEGVSMANLKHTLETLAKAMFGETRTIRLRPSYFQFTEPSVEVDVSCHLCGGSGCNICKQTGWIEVLGAGMVHPDVLRIAGYDPEKVSGFAFGCGVERIAMLKYGVDDIRHFYTNARPFLSVFKRFE